MNQKILFSKKLKVYKQGFLPLSILWLGIVCGVAFFVHLGSIGLVDKTEPMFVEAARQMSVTGDWITPYWNGETRFDKPPLSYWLMAIAFNLLGVNEWAARLPSAIIASAVTILGFYTLLHFGVSKPQQTPNSSLRWWVAGIGAGAIALNPAMIAWGRTGVSDMFLAGCMSLALLSFFFGYARQQFGWYLAFYVFVAGAILAKGPVGIVLPIGIVAAFLAYVGQLKPVLRELRPLLGLGVVLAIALPWFILVTLANGQEYINVFFGYHNVQRFTEVVSDHAGPWYFYFPVLLVGLAPWSIYLPITITQSYFWQRQRWMRSSRESQLGLFCLFWIIIIFVFFSIAVTKLPSYILPLMPAAAILVTLFFSHLIQSTNPSPKRNLGLILSGIFNVILLFSLAAASFWSPQLLGNDPTLPTLRQALQQSNLPLYSSLVWGIAAVASTLLLTQKNWQGLWSPNLAAMLAFMLFIAPPTTSLIDTERQLPLRQLSALITQVQQPNEELMMVGFIRPSVVFYTQKTVNFFSKPKSAFKYLQKEKPNSALLLIESRKLEKMNLQPSQYQILATSGAYQVLRLPKQTIARLN